MTEPRPTLRASIDAAEKEERQQAVRALLQRPLLTKAMDAEAFGAVRRHAVWLRDWFSRHPGWPLFVDVELARLVKTPGRPVDATHPACDPRHEHPFTRRRYVILCLALASLERAGRQTTLKRLAETIQAQLAGDPAFREAGVCLDPERREDRADLVAVGRTLLDWRVLERIHGDEESYLGAGGDCLYMVHRLVLARLLAVRRGPSLIEADELGVRLAELQDEPDAQGDDNRRRSIRRRLFRLLLERPVVYENELTDEERVYLRNQRHTILSELTEATGLLAEVRREGIALVDDAREMADFRMPQEGTEGHAALLLAAFLVGELRAEREAARLRGEAEPDVLVPMDAVEHFVAEAAERYGSRWRRDARTIEGASELARDLVRRFCALDLARSVSGAAGGAIRPLPALARYGLAEGDDTLAPRPAPCAPVQGDLLRRP